MNACQNVLREVGVCVCALEHVLRHLLHLLARKQVYGRICKSVCMCMCVSCTQGRLTLLLGPPSSGKSTLLKLLAGVAREAETRAAGCTLTGSITYNGETMDTFQVTI